MVINHIGIPPAADTAVVVRGGARPQCFGVGWTCQPVTILIKDLETEVHNLNIIIESHGAVGVRRAIPCLVSVAIGRGSQKFRRGNTERAKRLEQSPRRYPPP